MFKFLKNKNIRNKILYTIMMLMVYKLGCSITVPGINLYNLGGLGAESVWGIMNLLGGGALERMSVFALGVGPYITAGIVIQLLSMDVIPALSEMSKDGVKGKRKIEKITRYFTLVLAIMQGLSIVYNFDKTYGIMSGAKTADYIFVITVMVAGSQAMIWIGDRITAKGIGNGISLLIFAGIVSNIPANFAESWSILVAGAESGKMFNGILVFIIGCIIYLAIILGVVILELAVRRVPVQYSSNIGTMNNLTYLPFKINSASVLPVIFASSLITAPQIVLSFINQDAYQKVSSALSLQKPFGLILYGVLVVAFTFFYTTLQMDPKEIGNNLNKQNAYIPGIRPGSDTQTYLKKVLYRITFFGAAALLVLAMIPYLLPMLTPIPSNMSLGGTGIIIVVGVAMEMIRTVETETEARDYSKWSNN